MQLEIMSESNQFSYFPGSRYMGSKNKIINEIWSILKNYKFNSFFDAFAGSNVVSYFMKCQDKSVITNDFMKISYCSSKAIIENSFIKLTENELDFILTNKNKSNFISKTFKDLYFTNSENSFLDKVSSNIFQLRNEYQKAIALSALVRACMKKRPRGIFTYTGHRYDDGRKDINISLKEHFLNNIEIFNSAVFDNGHNCKAENQFTEDISINADLVYFDPPYFTPNSDNDYVRRYHFVEGLVRNWKDLEIQENTKTKKFKSFKSPFSNKLNAFSAFDELFSKYKKSIIVVSYSSNSLPTKDELTQLLKKYKSKVDVFEINLTYSFGNQNHKIGNGNNRVQEYLFIGS
ncbi:MAG: DNA adenine methylase [Melioribacteraceae bacterium]|nr:DNA adenine methylase [Melioribacteraceae bacterium]